MKPKYIIFLISILLFSCVEKKWKVNNSKPPVYNIPQNAIFFQDSQNGVFGGYGLKENPKSKNWDGIDMFPVIYKTKSLGKEFEKINISKEISGQVHKLYYQDSIIITQIENSIYKTENLGKSWNLLFSGNIETYNISFNDKNNFSFITRGNKNKFLLSFSNNKIDTLKILDFNTDFQLTKSNLYSWKKDKKNYESKTILKENLSTEKIDSISFKNLETIKYLFELEPSKQTIVTEKTIYLYNGKKNIDLNPKFYNDFYIKDFLANKNVLIAICKERNNKNSVTDDFYYISNDYGNTWNFLQKENGSNRSKFLLENKMLISFDSGLQYLNL